MNAIITTNNTTFETAKEQMDSYINSFNHYAKKCAENVLEMAKVVYDASEYFNTKPFDQFCLEVGLTDKGTVSKMKLIGKRYAILAPYKDRIPSAWTTLYSIAKATDEEFTVAIDENKLSVFTKASDIGEIFPRLKRVGKVTLVAENVEQQAKDYLFKIKSAASIAVERRAELQAKLQSVCLDFGIELISAD
jgi:hypothetical protein